MTLSLTLARRSRAARACAAVIAAAAIFATACASGGGRNKVPAGEKQPDKYLYDRGLESLEKKKWLTAREYFQTIVETYPQSTVRADAKLGVGDSLLGEGSLASQIQAIQEFREFLSFFPTHARADYAQYKLAMAHYLQMAKPERDQTETKEALREFDVFFERYPNSALMTDARKFYREARDRLSESEYKVGFFYYRSKWYPGAIDRLQKLLKADPQFTNRDAVYFTLAESLVKINRKAEALPHLEKLVQEFEQSEYLEKTQKLITELKAEPPAGVAPASTTNADGNAPGGVKPGEGVVNPNAGKPDLTKPAGGTPTVTPPAAPQPQGGKKPATPPPPPDQR